MIANTRAVNGEQADLRNLFSAEDELDARNLNMLSALSDVTIYGTSLCPTNATMTEIVFRAGDWIDGLTNITCSNGVVVEINAGSSSGGGEIFLSASQTEGFCELDYSYIPGSTNFDEYTLGNLTVTECMGEVKQGPLGDGTYFAPGKLHFEVTNTCVNGTSAVGLDYAALEGQRIIDLHLVCGDSALVEVEIVTDGGSAVIPADVTLAPTTLAPTTL